MADRCWKAAARRAGAAARWALGPARWVIPKREPRDLSRAKAWLLVLGAIASFTAGVLVWVVKAPDVPIISIELSGSGQAFPLPAGTDLAVRWNFAFTAGYGIALFLAIVLADAVFWTGQARKVLRAAPLLALGTVVADVTENVMVRTAIHRASARPWLDFATAASVLKYSCVIPATAVAVLGVLLTFGRMFSNRRRWGRKETRPLRAVQVFAPPPLEGDPRSASSTKPAEEGNVETRWRRGYLVPGLDDEELNQRGKRPTVGICLSGGGVRSASVALGALQELRKRRVEARYLVSVSGGGYTAGALQLALTSAEPSETASGTIVRDREQALMPGSVEEDRIRRHADYLADSPQQMLLALGVLARVMLVSLTVVLSTAVVAGVAIGRAYQAAPLVPWNPRLLDPTGGQVPFPGIRTGTWYLLLVLAGGALAFYLVSLLVAALPYSYEDESPGTRTTWFLRKVAGNLTGLLLIATAIGIALPSVIFGASWLLNHYGNAATAVGGSIGTVALTYVTTLAALGRRGKVVKRGKDLLSGKSPGGSGVPGGALRLLLTILTLTVLAAAWLLLMGGMAAISHDTDAVRVGSGGLAILVVLGLCLDQTELSLHPFYRRRLAVAFDARRVRRKDDGFLVAEQYPYEELTTLSTYGRQVEKMPEIIFAAAANLTGEQRAPLAAASFILSGAWIGGPDVGYVCTADAEAAVWGQIQRDLSVEAAVAVSGAAVASAMGRASRWYGTLLAVSGVRLGTWLPNPRFLAERAAARENDWRPPGMPTIRRLTYLLREIFGIHQASDRMLQVTDGGHYENLGLVELLRRRCTEIYCIDASGDSPPTAGTLAEAITLAEIELGVTISFPKQDVWKLVPGSVTPPLEPTDPLAPLNERLSESAVVVADITYPAACLPVEAQQMHEEGKLTGKLVIAKTLLTRDMSYELLSYAARNNVFPHDSTGDQFFDDGKFCAYRQLGREIGKQAAEVMSKPPTPEESPFDAPQPVTFPPSPPLHPVPPPES